MILTFVLFCYIKSWNWNRSKVLKSFNFMVVQFKVFLEIYISDKVISILQRFCCWRGYCIVIWNCLWDILSFYLVVKCNFVLDVTFHSTCKLVCSILSCLLLFWLLFSYLLHLQSGLSHFRVCKYHVELVIVNKGVVRVHGWNDSCQFKSV